MADEAARSTSNENFQQNASAPSFGAVADGSTAASLGQQVDEEKMERTSDAQESQLFSEQTQKLDLPEGGEEDDFLPDEEEVKESMAAEDVAIGRRSEPTSRTINTSTENLDNPISIEEADLFCPEDQEETLIDCVPAKASDYIPRPFAAITEPQIPSLSNGEPGPSDSFRVPRLPSPADRMTRVIDQYLPAQTEGDEEGFFDQDEPGSYHSGDTEHFEMDHRPVLDRAAIKRDIYNFVEGLEHLSTAGTYRVVDRLGEGEFSAKSGYPTKGPKLMRPGTFSSVYAAYDEVHDFHNNKTWTGKSPIKTKTPIIENKTRVKVALKKILATSSPSRIQNELHILESLR